MIKNIIFDIGGVIVDYKFGDYVERLGLDKKTTKVLSTQVLYTPLWDKFSKGLVSAEEFLTETKKQVPEYAEYVDMLWKTENLRKMIPPFERTLNLIKQLKEKGYKLFVISDMEEYTIRYLKSTIEGFEDLFDDIIYSCRVGQLKKDGDVFDLAIKRFAINPEESIFIDDVQRNLDQAQKRNINTFHFTDPKQNVIDLKKMFL